MMLVAITGVAFHQPSRYVDLHGAAGHDFQLTNFSGFFLDLTSKNARDIWNHGIPSGNLT